jgi:hypothetical protein
MKKWTLTVTVAVLLAMHALACGFPFPAGSSMVAVSKAVCAEDEAAASCQQRQDAYQLMGKLQSAQVVDMAVSVLVNDGESLTEMSAEGMFEYAVTGSTEGLGADIHATLTGGTINTGGAEESLENVEFIVVGGTGYTYDDGAWTYEELDQNTLLGLGMLLGLTGPTGVGFDLFNAPGIFTVTEEPDADIDGQRMHVQTLTLDLEALLTDAEALAALFDASAEGTAELGLDMSELGDPAEFAMIAVLLLPAFEGSEFSTTIYIGADDGYIHRVEESYVFMLDTGAIAFAEEGDATRMELTYSLVGTITAHNESLMITAPADAQEGEGLLDDGGLFGSGGGLGDSLFGN